MNFVIILQGKYHEKLCGSIAIALRSTCGVGNFCRFFTVSGCKTACKQLRPNISAPTDFNMCEQSGSCGINSSADVAVHTIFGLPSPDLHKSLLITISLNVDSQKKI